MIYYLNLKPLLKQFLIINVPILIPNSFHNLLDYLMRSSSIGSKFFDGFSQIPLGLRNDHKVKSQVSAANCYGKEGDHTIKGVDILLRDAIPKYWAMVIVVPGASITVETMHDFVLFSLSVGNHALETVNLVSVFLDDPLVGFPLNESRVSESRKEDHSKKSQPAEGDYDVDEAWMIDKIEVVVDGYVATKDNCADYDRGNRLAARSQDEGNVEDLEKWPCISPLSRFASGHIDES